MSMAEGKPKYMTCTIFQPILCSNLSEVSGHLIFIAFCRRSRSQSRGSLFAVGGSKNHPSSNSLDTPNSHPGSRRTSKPSILIEPDPEIYGKMNIIIRHLMSFQTTNMASALTVSLLQSFL